MEIHTNDPIQPHYFPMIPPPNSVIGLLHYPLSTVNIQLLASICMATKAKSYPDSLNVFELQLAASLHECNLAYLHNAPNQAAICPQDIPVHHLRILCILGTASERFFPTVSHYNCFQALELSGNAEGVKRSTQNDKCVNSPLSHLSTAAGLFQVRCMGSSNPFIYTGTHRLIKQMLKGKQFLS